MTIQGLQKAAVIHKAALSVYSWHCYALFLRCFHLFISNPYDIQCCTLCQMGAKVIKKQLKYL